MSVGGRGKVETSSSGERGLCVYRRLSNPSEKSNKLSSTFLRSDAETRAKRRRR